MIEDVFKKFVSGVKKSCRHLFGKTTEQYQKSQTAFGIPAANVTWAQNEVHFWALWGPKGPIREFWGLQAHCDPTMGPHGAQQCPRSPSWSQNATKGFKKLSETPSKTPFVPPLVGPYVSPLWAQMCSPLLVDPLCASFVGCYVLGLNPTDCWKHSCAAKLRSIFAASQRKNASGSQSDGCKPSM